MRWTRRASKQIVRAVLPVRLPRAPDVIMGVIHVRGRVVPLLDLRLRFALPARPLRADDVFVIVEAKTRLLALRGDRTSELVRVPLDRLTAIAESSPRTRYAAGTAVLPDGLLVICDVDAFLDDTSRLCPRPARRACGRRSSRWQRRPVGRAPCAACSTPCPTTSQRPW
jgi:purine-binding chemotaxis protein CheW